MLSDFQFKSTCFLDDKSPSATVRDIYPDLLIVHDSRNLRMDRDWVTDIQLRNQHITTLKQCLNNILM